MSKRTVLSLGWNIRKVEDDEMTKTKKRPDGLYQKQVMIGRKADGSYKRKTIYGKTLKELDDKVADVKHQLKIGVRIDNDLSFKELSDIWLDNYRLVTKTPWAKAQRSLLDLHVIPDIGEIKVKDLTKYDLQSVVNKMRDNGLSTSTMRKTRYIAAQVLEVALDKKIVINNPFKGVSIANIPPQKRRALTEEEIELISNSWQEHRMGYAVLTMLYCGLRRGEVLALDWDDIDLNNKIIHVTKSVFYLSNQPIIKGPKSRAGIRDIPIPDFLVDIYKSIPKKNAVFLPSEKGQRMSEISYSRAWDSYEKFLNIQAGGSPGFGGKGKNIVIDHITAHMLRHTYASLLYEAGVDIKSAQKFLGHSDIETTLEIYTHLTKRKETEAINSINEHFITHYKRSDPAMKKKENDKNKAAR